MEENISKTLLIAGEVLIGVIILSILVVTFRRVAVFTESYMEYSDYQDVLEFNKDYTSYVTNNNGTDSTYIYAEDVVTLANHVIDWNKTTPNNSEKIVLYIYGQTGAIEYNVTKEADFNGKEFLSTYKLTDNPSNPEYKFSCEVQLSNATGRVNVVKVTNKGQVTT